MKPYTAVTRTTAAERAAVQGVQRKVSDRVTLMMLRLRRRMRLRARGTSAKVDAAAGRASRGRQRPASTIRAMSMATRNIRQISWISEL